MVNVQGVLDQMKMCVLIPVHNESEKIGPLVASIKQKGSPVVVVDDGSQDDSGKIASEHGAFVLFHEKKQGKGRSLQDGFEYVLKEGYDWVLTMDGDGQHDVDDISRFLEKARTNEVCIITGNRMHNPLEMPLVRLWTNRMMSSLISFLCRQKIPDTQCGFRLIPCEILRHLILSSSDFEIETEVLVKASKKGFKIYSVPIKTIYLGGFSRINPFLDTIRFLAYIIREIRSPKKSQ